MSHSKAEYLTELLDSVWAKGDQARAPGGGLDPLHPIIGGGVAPEQVHEHHAAILHGDGPLQGCYLLYLCDGPANSCHQHICLSQCSTVQIFELTSS